jgi:hypothetical protein
MTVGAIRTRRHRAARYAAEVDAVRTVHGVDRGAPIGPVLREELWAHRYRGAGLTVRALADRFRAIAEEEGVPVDQIADRYDRLQVRPSRQRAGERLADLVVTDGRPDWADPDRLVEMIEPTENGTPNPVYVRVVRDLDGRDWVLVASYDGSEPMVWPSDAAGRKAAAWEALERVRAVREDPTGYETWLAANGATGSTGTPFTQTMTTGDWLAHTDHMHLT